MSQVLLAVPPAVPAQRLTDEEIIEIRDDHLPSQGEAFDCIAFAREVLRRAAPPPAEAAASPDDARAPDASPDQLIELTMHLERMRASAIVANVAALEIGGASADMPTPFQSGYQMACEEILHRLKTEAWGLLSNGGWGPTGAANEDDRPSPEFPALLRKVLAAAPDAPAAQQDETLQWQPRPTTNVVPGKVHCAKCGFTLVRTNLYVNSGTTGPGDEKVEPCPNDGNPLLPITWEQEAREAWARFEHFFDRAVTAEKALAVAPAAQPVEPTDDARDAARSPRA